MPDTPDTPATPTPTPSAATLPDLRGQSALVTGATSGIGKACAIQLAACGANVAVNYRSDPADAAPVVALIEAAGGRALAVKADVSREDEVVAMFAQAVQAFGTLDIVVCNAGLQQDAPFEQMTLQQWNTVINVNLTGQFLCAREAAREFKRRGPRPEVSRALGKIICMSSVHQRIAWAGHANYAASKGGIRMLMETIAQELAPAGIRVNAIAPGAIRTPINTNAWNTPEAYAQLMKLVPYKRIGEPEDIARTVAWLVSDAADYVTGATLFVDGGMALYPGFEGNG